MASGIQGVDDYDSIVVNLTCVEHDFGKVIYLNDRGSHKASIQSALCCSSCTVDFFEHDCAPVTLKDMLGL